MPIDPDVAIGAQLYELDFSWSPSDVLLYHLALGAGRKPTDARELRYAYERDLHVLPTFAVVAPSFHETRPPVVSFPGIDIDLAKVLHGSQSVTLNQPIPVQGKAVLRSHIADVLDKGSAAVILQDSQAVTPDGDVLWTTQSRIFARDEGGFGGHRGETERVELPDRSPDAEVLIETMPQQALWYRLCGDRNPLHVDPEFAAGAGFPAPILHGLCSYGLVCKAVVDAMLDGDVTRVASYGTRFAGVVYPGETIRTQIWDADGRFLLRADVPSRDHVQVLADATLTTAL